MKVLVIGSGGREHALAWKLSQEAEVICAPGNAGMTDDVETLPLDMKDPQAAIDLASRLDAGLVVVGPEDPLVDGLADRVRAADIPVFGPGAEGARLEGSKAFSKGLMKSAGIPTARFQAFVDPELAREYARAEDAAGRQVVVKASGTALGKGVTVSSNLDEAIAAIDRMMVHREFGEAGARIVVEECLTGREFSLLTLVGDQNFVSLPVAQDYKRVLDGDRGPNTGGMGAYSPCKWATDAMVDLVERSMVVPILKELGGSYRGTLFTGVMVTPEGPKCLEYNVRLGDPETQTIMRRLGGGFLEALFQAAKGEKIVAPQVSPEAAVTVVMASGGYPGNYRKNVPIHVGPVPFGGKLFWAGVSSQNGELVTSGGRVLGATGAGSTVEEARRIAYGAAKAAEFDGAILRNDIAAQAD